MAVQESKVLELELKGASLCGQFRSGFRTKETVVCPGRTDRNFGESSCNTYKPSASKTWSHCAMPWELSAARAAITREECVIWYFADRVCTAYTLLVRAIYTSYWDSLNTMLSDAETRNDHFGGLLERVFENGN